MKIKSQIMDELAIRRAMARIAHEIIEKDQGVDDLVLLGIRRRGVPLAHMLADQIERFEGVRIPVGELDATRHRDDLTEADKIVLAGDCHIPCEIRGKKVVLVDDVFFTGRTVRAALEAIFAYGRPQVIQLAVLIDRGHRELPIRADYVGKNVPTSLTESISVRVTEYDQENAVYICDEDERSNS